jgi:hypothetical protein
MSRSSAYSNVFETDKTPTNGSNKIVKDPTVVKLSKEITDTTVKVAAVTGVMTGYNISFKTIIEWLFFLSFGALILFLLLVVLNYAGFSIFSFTPDQTGIISVPTAENKQISNTKVPAVYNVTYNFTGLNPYNVTFGIDIFIDSDFSTTVPRVLWYRANGYVVVPPNSTEDSLQTLFPSSNIVLYLDSLKNDLKIFLQGTGGSVQTDTCIENVPIGKPFRVNFVITTKFVEIYLTGRLVKTVTLDENLLQTPVESNVFGPPQQIVSVKVANASYWSYPLSPTMIRQNGMEAINPTIFT